MGNRESLIAGAKTCLVQKGYGRTTARDIASAAGVSLAAIGYHFGSKEALLNEAMREALDEWGADVGRALAPAGPTSGYERFVATWQQAIASLSEPNVKALWTTQFEVLSVGQPGLLADLSKLQGEAREGLAHLFGGVDADADPAEVNRIGSFFQALLLGVVVLYLFDPAKAPSPEDLVASIRTVADRIAS
ncbi:TetR/AcrR family transcriptional regulator [Kribbella albertanoniae]|uniref:TetR/AcrR family transcriptional regulator n=1 Tax=Kribbella albertanoniae TaxID=1266829 RepID=A0A4R4P0H0_9ACTN|nr:TetR/AcrR family transcriptional regulator [Kribbella albertanoniae]TDC15701.1 TetR/AcrR family transcriptional regulator [Kribbella albertanoniae]